MDAQISGPRETGAARCWAIFVLTLLIVGASIAWYRHVLSTPFEGDTTHYVAMARGRVAEVRQPFTSRVLQPAIVGFLTRTTGLSLDRAFFLTTTVGLAALVSIGMIFITRQIPSLGFALALVFAPMVLYLFRDIYMPDCLHAGIAAVFFLLLAYAEWMAVPLLFLLQVAREATVLLTACFVLVAAYRRKWKLAGAAILFTVLGMGVVNRVVHQGLGNIHDTNVVVYLVTKVPFNFATNVFGLEGWTNTHAANDPTSFPDKPMISFDLPKWAPTGSIRKVGIYRFNPGIPLILLRLLLTHLGVMPSVVFSVIYWRGWRLVRDDGLSFVCLVALTYGLASYLLVPVLGSAIVRYASYGWPMAWIAAPELLVRYFRTDNRLITRLAWLQVVTCWAPWLLLEIGVGPILADLIAVFVGLFCQITTIKMLWRNRICED